MKIALSVWKNRISPVFDVSRQVLVVDVEQGEVMDRNLETLPDIPGQRLATLQGLEVRALICGAISQPLVNLAQSLGMEVMPFVAGDVDEVVTACVSGTLENPCFAMPGCQGPHRRYVRACTCSLGERRRSMPNQDGTGPQGRGRGQGGGRGRGRCQNPSSENGGQKGAGRGLGRNAGQSTTSKDRRKKDGQS